MKWVWKLVSTILVVGLLIATMFLSHGTYDGMIGIVGGGLSVFLQLLVGEMGKKHEARTRHPNRRRR